MARQSKTAGSLRFTGCKSGAGGHRLFVESKVSARSKAYSKSHAQEQLPRQGRWYTGGEHSEYT